jgi:hypothetical protein
VAILAGRSHLFCARTAERIPQLSTPTRRLRFLLRRFMEGGLAVLHHVKAGPVSVDAQVEDVLLVPNLKRRAFALCRKQDALPLRSIERQHHRRRLVTLGGKGNVAAALAAGLIEQLRTSADKAPPMRTRTVPAGSTTSIDETVIACGLSCAAAGVSQWVQPT